MAVNTAFHTSNSAAIATEKTLYSNLVAEAIQIYGHDVYYMDRTLVNEDTILGVDPLSKFKDAAKIEMYMEDADGGFAGERELISQFGLENLSEATFVVNKLRFQEMTKQVTIESGTSSEEGGSILLEAGTIDMSADAVVFEGSDFYILQEVTATDSDRPLEGDAIYHPILEKMFQINFVDHDEPFHQLDNNPVYKLRCRLFDYSTEALDTGISDIDAIETTETLDALIYQFTLEQSSAVNEDIRLENGITNAGLVLEETDGDNITGEDDTTSVGESIILEQPADSGDAAYLLNEDYIIGDFSTDKTTQNELFEVQSRSVLDFSESNPFGDVGSSS